jgi:ectoine hydroxylase-related dioxygenase (phytanoyl-CoA dioxygenase family)
MGRRNALRSHDAGPVLDDTAGWTTVPGLLGPAAANRLAVDCAAALAAVGRDGRDLRVGDEPHGGTRRLVDVVDRVPGAAAVLADERLQALVHHLLGPDLVLVEATFRCPSPGHGGQRLHTDDVPRTGASGPARRATAVVALTGFTAENGATRLVPGSHRRPDLQRRAGRLDRHPDEVVVTAPAGTGIVFTGHLLHSGTPNRSARPRPALQIVWRRR